MKISINQVVSLQSATKKVSKWVHERKQAHDEMKDKGFMTGLPCPPPDVLQAMYIIENFVQELGGVEVNIKA